MALFILRLWFRFGMRGWSRCVRRRGDFRRKGIENGLIFGRQRLSGADFGCFIVEEAGELKKAIEGPRITFKGLFAQQQECSLLG
jgi:hypothetical protein